MYLPTSELLNIVSVKFLARMLINVGARSNPRVLPTFHPSSIAVVTFLDEYVGAGIKVFGCKDYKVENGEKYLRVRPGDVMVLGRNVVLEPEPFQDERYQLEFSFPSGIEVNRVGS